MPELSTVSTVMERFLRAPQPTARRTRQLGTRISNVPGYASNTWKVVEVHEVGG